MFGKKVIFILSLCFFSLSAMAADHKEDKLTKALAKYEKTGKVEKCVRLSDIDSTRVIDDYNILFIMKGKKAYLNSMKHRCPRLGFEEAFSYKVSVNQLCDIDIITVLDANGGIPGPSCGLGKFVGYTKKHKIEDTHAK